MHVPFCAAKCHYCDFYSFAAESRDADGFVERLLGEVRRRRVSSPTTVFVGGGTPTWLPIPALQQLFDSLDELTGFRTSAAEVTVECNPESLDPEKARALVELGATRLSVGVQSLQPRLLELFGRVHAVDDSFRALDAALASGARDVSADLIYAAPEEDVDEWEADLARVLAVGLTHVSAYNLAYEPGTAFHRWRDQGRVEPLPEERELEFFWRTRARFADAGFEAYETSNFASNGRVCHHNANYWRNGPYVGVGPSAVSKVGQLRFGNARSLERWREAVATSGPLEPEWQESLEPDARLGETWWLGLRTSEGVDPGEARATAEWSGADDPCEAEADRLVEQELLERAGDRYRLTERGLPLADAVATRFVALETS